MKSPSLITAGGVVFFLGLALGLALALLVDLVALVVFLVVFFVVLGLDTMVHPAELFWCTGSSKLLKQLR